MSGRQLILAPLRGVTIRCFRRIFAGAIHDAGFTEAITPFISANAGVDPLGDRELRPPDGGATAESNGLLLTPQFIGKDPAALRFCLERVKSAGYATADLNCGCPFPMVRNKGRGSGMLRTPDTLRRMLEAGCETMGPGRFSVKARLGVSRPDELLALMPVFNEFPLRMLTVHARTAEQMYSGACDAAALAEIAAAAKMPVVPNGDLPLPDSATDRTLAGGSGARMVGRAFLLRLGGRGDIGELLDRYVEASVSELCGERPVLGRIKELMSYWRELPRWRRRWQVAKLARSLDELRVWRGI